MSFESVWLKLQTRLQEDYRIEAWGKHRGYTGGSFRIYAFDNDFVIVKLDSSIRHINIPKKDFENVFSVWDEYIHGNMKRSDLTDITWHSTYIISIFNYLNV